MYPHTAYLAIALGIPPPTLLVHPAASTPDCSPLDSLLVDEKVEQTLEAWECSEDDEVFGDCEAVLCTSSALPILSVDCAAMDISPEELGVTARDTMYVL